MPTPGQAKVVPSTEVVHWIHELTGKGATVPLAVYQLTATFAVGVAGRSVPLSV